VITCRNKRKAHESGQLAVALFNGYFTSTFFSILTKYQPKFSELLFVLRNSVDIIYAFNTSKFMVEAHLSYVTWHTECAHMTLAVDLRSCGVKRLTSGLCSVSQNSIAAQVCSIYRRVASKSNLPVLRSSGRIKLEPAHSDCNRLTRLLQVR